MMHKDLFASKILQALGELGEKGSPLTCLDALRQQFEPELARQAAHLHDLRKRCKSRIGIDLLPYLQEPNASQVTAPRLADYRAGRIAKLTPGSHIWDSTCGLGMEALHLKRHDLRVVASDRNAEIAQYALANLRYHSLDALVLCADALKDAVKADGILMDPDRRPMGKRTMDPTAWSPTLSQCLEKAEKFAGAAIKLPPGGRYPEDWARSHRVEWISLAGELLECCLWLGTWAPEPQNLATRIERDGSISSFSGQQETASPLSQAQAESVQFLGDPDPSLVRSGLLGSFANKHGWSPLAPPPRLLGRPKSR